MTVTPEIAAQIDEAFDFRGHVTISFKDGKTVEGYLFNRELAPMKDVAYIEVIAKDSDSRLRFPADSVKSVIKSGKDFASPFVAPKKD